MKCCTVEADYIRFFNAFKPMLIFHNIPRLTPVLIFQIEENVASLTQLHEMISKFRRFKIDSS